MGSYHYCTSRNRRKPFKQCSRWHCNFHRTPAAKLRTRWKRVADSVMCKALELCVTPKLKWTCVLSHGLLFYLKMVYVNYEGRRTGKTAILKQIDFIENICSSRLLENLGHWSVSVSSVIIQRLSWRLAQNWQNTRSVGAKWLKNKLR